MNKNGEGWRGGGGGLSPTSAKLLHNYETVGRMYKAPRLFSLIIFDDLALSWQLITSYVYNEDPVKH